MRPGLSTTGPSDRHRFAAEGPAGLVDRSSWPTRSPNQLDDSAQAEIEALRRQRLTGAAIARRTRRLVSAIGVVLGRRGLGRLAALNLRAPARRYERERPGELIHIDIEKLGRIDAIDTVSPATVPAKAIKGQGLGWEYLHMAVAVQGVLTTNVGVHLPICLRISKRFPFMPPNPIVDNSHDIP